MSSREVTKTQKYLKLFKVYILEKSYSEGLLL